MPLIVFEGIDASGKTTQSELLYKYMVNNKYNVKLMKFPDRSTDIGKLIDKVLKDPDYKIKEEILYLLFAANRAEHEEILLDSKGDDKYVICDRYMYSSIAYNNVTQEWVKDVEGDYLPEPDYLFYLDLSPSSQKCRTTDEERHLNRQTEIHDNYKKLFSKLTYININANNSIDNITTYIKKILNI